MRARTATRPASSIRRRQARLQPPRVPEAMTRGLPPRSRPVGTRLRDTVRTVEQRVSLVTLGVSDLGRARRFYEGLGWTTNAKPEDDVVFFQAGGLILALWRRASLAPDS